MKRFFYIIFIAVLISGIGFIVLIFLLPGNKIIIENKTAFQEKEIAKESVSETDNLQITDSSEAKRNLCADEILFLSEVDRKFCFQESKLTKARGLAVDLTNNRALLYDSEKLIKIFPLSYQSPEGKWFQAPTGYYQIGIKKEKHLSSLFPVIMPYAVQFYEDFFIHGIPYYKNGVPVSSSFTGGCLRFNNQSAKEIYDFIKTGDEVVVYKTFDDLEIKEEFHPPVDLDDFWIRQRFLNPYRQFNLFGGTENLRFDYYQHTGLDFAPNRGSKKLSVYAIADARIVKIQPNNGNDHGLGNTVILEHQINSKKIYSLYAHLVLIKDQIQEGDIIKQGEIIGEVGNSGFGCQNYWRVGQDGCDSQAIHNDIHDIHLHFEIKKTPVLENPEGGQVCQTKLREKRFCYGYTPDYPQNYGYLNPTEFLFNRVP